jgi:hypothetical protein
LYVILKNAHNSLAHVLYECCISYAVQNGTHSHLKAFDQSVIVSHNQADSETALVSCLARFLRFESYPLSLPRHS